LVLLNKLPVWFCPKTNNGPKKSNGAEKSDAAHLSRVSLTFIRGTINIDNLVSKLTDARNQASWADAEERVNKNRFCITDVIGTRGQYPEGKLSSMHEAQYGQGTVGSADKRADYRNRIIGYTWQDIGWNTAWDESPFEFFAYSKTVMSVLEDLRFWNNNAKWYRDRHIPWRYGVLLHGPSGSGKSSFIRAVGDELNIPISMFDIASMTNYDLIREWKRVTLSVPAIIAIEDIDAVFRGRENTTQGRDTSLALTFDCLLNRISGVNDNDGVILFITTNDVSSLDPALYRASHLDGVSRPGRIDVCLELNGMCEEARTKVATNVLRDCKDLIPQIVADGKNDQPAQFHQRCSQAAIARLWTIRNALVQQ
jgi:hypothetical protein